MAQETTIADDVAEYRKLMASLSGFIRSADADKRLDPLWTYFVDRMGQTIRRIAEKIRSKTMKATG